MEPGFIDSSGLAGSAMKKILIGVLVGSFVVLLLAVGVRQAMIWNKTRDVLPEFKPIPEGSRAPTLVHAGVTVGTTTFAEVRELTARLGYECRDTSMRGLMQLGRETAQKAIAEAREQGFDPDTISGASRAYYYSKKEQNPQIQWTCEHIDLAHLDPSFASPSDKNTVTLIFDSARHPLRYVVTSRKFQSQAAAKAAREISMGRFEQALGPSPTQIGQMDERPGQKLFPRMRVVTNEWSYADRRIAVTVMNMGPPKGIDVREIVEIPWPIVTEP